MTTHERLETEDVNKLLFSLSIPAFIAMMANGIYNIIDTILIGRGVGTLAIGAIAIGFPIQALYIAFSQLVAIGTAQAISREIGHHNTDKASHIATNAYTLTLLISLALTALSLIFLDELLLLFGATDDIIDYARQYIAIIAIGITFNATSLLTNAILRAQSYTLLTTYSVLIGILTSLCLSPLFVLVFGWGIKGAAIGTVCSQLASCLFGIFFIIKRHIGIPLKVNYLMPNITILKQITTVGLSAFARNSSTSLCALIINNILKVHGGSFTILTFGIVNRLVSFFFLPVLGVTQALQPIAGYNFGAKHYSRILKVLRFGTIYATLLCCFGTAISFLFPSQLLSLFTNDQEVVTAGVDILKLKTVFFGLVGVQMVTATLFQSLGKAIPSLFLSLLRQFILLLPLVLLLTHFTDLGSLGVFIAFPISEVLSFIITLGMLLHQVKQLMKLAN